MDGKTFGLGMDAGRERRVRELCEEISRKRLSARKRSRKQASRAFGLSEDALKAIEDMPGAMWDGHEDFMTCQGFAPVWPKKN